MKQITLDTNFNSKLDGNIFLHITQAPTELIPESLLRTPTEIIVKDGSHPPVMARIIDMARVKLGDILGLYTYASHGLNHQAFVEWWCLKYPACTFNTEMSVYVWQRMSEQEVKEVSSGQLAVGKTASESEPELQFTTHESQ